MKRIWINYNKWEDFRNGLYETKKINNEEFIIGECVELLSDQDRFYKYGLEMISLWPNSSNHNLSDIKANRKSYLGQSVCNFLFKANIKIVIKAWNLIDVDTQNSANDTALKIIKFYEENIYQEPVGLLNEKLS